jgi:hypothetical protein
METLRAVEWGVGTQQIEQDRCLPVHAADLRPEEESEDKTIAELTRPGHVLKIKRNEKRKLIYLQLKCRARTWRLVARTCTLFLCMNVHVHHNMHTYVYIHVGIQT